MTPRVAIVLLHYAGVDLTARCVRGLRAMDYANSDLCVVDNAAAEPCRQEVEQLWPGAVVVRAEKNRGVAGGRNDGFQLARDRGAAWAFCVDDDVTVERGTLSMLVKRATDTERVAAVGPKVFTVERPTILLHAVGKHYALLCFGRSLGGGQADVGQFDLIEESDWFPGMAVLYNLETVERIGGFDESLSPYGPEDQDWCLRARRRGYRILLASRARVWHPAPGAAIDMGKLENLVRGRLVWLRHQPEAHVRVLGFLYTVFQFAVRPLFRLARSGEMDGYYSSLWRGVRRAWRQVRDEVGR